MEPLTIIVVTYNRLEYTKRTIESLVKTVPDARFFIYDNHSTESGFEDWFRACGQVHKQVQIIMSDKNRGWGSAVNDAVRLATSITDVTSDSYVLISNNDVVYHEGWYEKCLQAYKDHPKLGVLGVWKHTSHGVLETRGNLVIKDQMPAVGWLMKRSVINDIGSFAEHGPCPTKGGNGEDVDYCIRAGWKGYLVAGLTEDVALHIDGY